jgi:hypothetical protein
VRRLKNYGEIEEDEIEADAIEGAEESTAPDYESRSANQNLESATRAMTLVGCAILFLILAAFLPLSWGLLWLWRNRGSDDASRARKSSRHPGPEPDWWSKKESDWDE